MTFFRCLVVFSFILFASNAFSQAVGQYRIQIVYSNVLMSKNDKFKFSLGGSETITVDWNNRSVYFNRRLSTGQRYRVTQLSGPRTCSFWSNNGQGTVAGTDIQIGVNCGFPPRVNGTLTVSGIEQGETFVFGNEYGNTYYATINRTYPIQNFPIGDEYIFRQASGPRQCRMNNAEGVVTNSGVNITAMCGKVMTGGNPTPTPTPTPIPPTSTTNFTNFDLVSRSSDDKIIGTFYEAFTPVIGGSGADEGRYVAFVTYAKGLGGGSGKFRQVVWRDRKTGETRLVSHGVNGVEGDQNSHNPVISADGRSVAFESYATNLTPDSNNVRDVFVWNADTNTVTAVSENRGIEANSECFEPTISADGRLIAFSSSASNLTPGVDGTSTVNVFLRDMRSGAVTLISKNEKDGKGGGGSRPSISADGLRIAFHNYFPLTKEDQNNLWDIYVWQSGNPKLKRISKTAAGGDKDQGDESSSRVVSPTISGDGRFVTFATTATNMVGNDTNKFQDAYLAEVDSGRITLLSVANGTAGDDNSPAGQGEPIAISYDGSSVVFSTKAASLGGSLVVRNLTEGSRSVPVVPQMIDGVQTSVSVPAISRTGKCVVFGSNARLDKRFPSSGIFVACSGNALN